MENDSIHVVCSSKIVHKDRGRAPHMEFHLCLCEGRLKIRNGLLLCSGLWNCLTLPFKRIQTDRRAVEGWSMMILLM
jgi:hypothetical protein